MNPGPRFNASVLYGHQTVLSNVMWRMQMGQVFSLTPDEYRQLNDLAGCLNYYSARVAERDSNLAGFDDAKAAEQAYYHGPLDPATLDADEQRGGGHQRADREGRATARRGAIGDREERVTMKLTIEIPDTGTPLFALRALGEALLAAAASKPDTPTPDDAITFPYYDASAGHTFATRAEWDDYRRRVAERDGNLAAFDDAQAAEQARHYHGPLDPATLDADDWAIHAQHPQLWNRGDIFSRSDRGWPAGQDSVNNARTRDVAEYKARGGRLAPWL